MDYDFNVIELDMLTDIVNNLDNNEIIEISKKRKRQDYVNKASQKSRNKKKERYIAYENHIKELHNFINSDLLQSKKISNLKKCINTFNKNIKL